MSDVSEVEVKKVKKAAKKVKKAAKKKAASKGKRGGKPGVAPGGGKKAAAARAQHHGVEVGGKKYKSTWEAWQALKLPPGTCQTFRKKLKAEKKATYETESGKKHNFKLIDVPKAE